MSNQSKKPLEKTVRDLSNIKDEWIHRLDEIPGFDAGIFSCLKEYLESALIDEMINMYVGKIRSNRVTCERINKRNMTYHRSPNELERDRKVIEKCKSDNVIFRNALTEMYELYSGEKVEMEEGETYTEYMERVILTHKDYLDFCVQKEDKRGMRCLESVYEDLHTNYTNSQKKSNLFSRTIYMMSQNNEECLGYLVQMPSYDDVETIKLYTEFKGGYNGTLPKEIYEETIEVIEVYQESVNEEARSPYKKGKDGQYDFFELIGVDDRDHKVIRRKEKSANPIESAEQPDSVDSFAIIDETDYEFPDEEISDSEEQEA